MFGLQLNLDDSRFWARLVFLIQNAVVQSAKEASQGSKGEFNFIKVSEHVLELLSLWQGQEL